MRYRIHHFVLAELAEDNFIVSGDTIEEVRAAAKRELARRGWKEEDCWSEDLPC